MRSQNFDRDCAIKARVERAVNFSHAACAKQGLDFVRAEFCARGKSHFRSRNYSVSGDDGVFDQLSGADLIFFIAAFSARHFAP